jgi:ribosomal protein L3 glutamine methyltransferase
LHIGPAPNGYDARPMTATELKSLLTAADSRARWVDAIADYFSGHALHYGHGTDCAEDEAFWLVWQLSGNPSDLAALPPDDELADRVIALAERRVRERRPLGYLLGTAWFAGLEFRVTPNVLIPRSPLAELVERGFLPWLELAAGDRILDVGTGSGCIAIAAAVHNPGISVDATEIAPAALAVARENVARHGVGDRVKLIEADLFPPGSTRYRVIMSNPPYVPSAEVAVLPPEYRHEPQSALDGGVDGLDPARRLLAGASSRLTADGVLIVEVGGTAATLEAAFPKVPWTWLEFERGGDGVFLLSADDLKHGWR